MNLKFLEILILLFIGVAVSVLGDIFLKKSGAGHNLVMLTTGMILYAAAAIPVAMAFKLTQFGIVFLIWEAMIVVLALAVGSLFFKEGFTVYKILALVTALSTIVFSYLAHKA